MNILPLRELLMCLKIWFIWWRYVWWVYWMMFYLIPRSLNFWSVFREMLSLAWLSKRSDVRPLLGLHAPASHALCRLGGTTWVSLLMDSSGLMYSPLWGLDSAWAHLERSIHEIPTLPSFVPLLSFPDAGGLSKITPKFFGNHGQFFGIRTFVCNFNSLHMLFFLLL